MDNIIKSSFSFKRFFLLVMVLQCFSPKGFSGDSFSGKDKPLFLPEIKTHLLESVYVDQTFEIHVMQPVMRKDGTERFPVLYATDADLNFGSLKEFTYTLYLGNHTPRYILVGIGYPGDARLTMMTLRQRDLFQLPEKLQAERLRSWKAAPTSLIEGGDQPDVKNLYAGAGDFLKFIQKELFPLIDKNYPTISDDRYYYGYSAGGSFGLYTLFTEPETFKRYVIGSPSVSYAGEDWVYDMAEAYISSGKRLDARVYISVGLEEQFEEIYAEHKLVSSFYHLTKKLQQAKIPGLQLHTQVFPGEIHMTGWAPNFMHGVRHILSIP